MVIGFLVCGLFSAAADEGAVAVLHDRLQHRRIAVGIHGASYVFVGSYEMEVENPSEDEFFILKREECSVKAEFLANRALIQALRVEVTAKDNTRLETHGQIALNEDSGSYALLSGRRLRDALVLESVEDWNPETKKYQVAVAVAWCAKQKMDEEDLSASDSQMGKRAGDPGAWEKWARRVDLASIVGARKFWDSNGELRYVGIGCADVEGLDVKSPWMRRAQEVALVRARANLSLALYAETVSEETLIQLQRELFDSGERSSISFESYVGTINRHSDKRTAFAPEVYATFVTHPITKRKMFVSVCGYEPWQLVELGIVDRNMLQASKVEQPPQMDSKVNPGVMIFNPNSGKFEKQ